MAKPQVDQKPSPIVSEWARPFWQGTAESKLMLQRCNDCSKYIFYPRVICPHCSSENVSWSQASGRGKVYSYTEVRNNAPSAFKSDTPYVVAVIELEEGVRMLSNIVGCSFDELRCDMPVRVVFERLNDDIVLPKFQAA